MVRTSLRALALAAVLCCATSRASAADGREANIVAADEVTSIQDEAATAPEVAAPAARSVTAQSSTLPAGMEKPDARIMGILANYRTADQSVPFKAITAQQKYSIFYHDSFDWPGYFIVGYYTGLAQLEGRNPEFGQGIKGYAKRYGTTYGDQVVGNFMTEFAMPALFHEDPRYYRMAHGPVMARAGYAVSRLLVTRTDRDTRTLNIAELAGNFAAAGVGNAWYTQARGWGDTADRFQNQLLNDAISNCIKEFWPDIKRKLGPKRSRQAR